MRASDEREKLVKTSRKSGGASRASSEAMGVRRIRVDGRSVHFDHAVDLPSEPEASEKSDGSCEQKETKDHDTSVTEVEECRSAPRNLQLSDKILNTIYDQVESREATYKKASPPPMIILCAQMKVAQEDGGLGTSYRSLGRSRPMINTPIAIMQPKPTKTLRMMARMQYQGISGEMRK